MSRLDDVIKKIQSPRKTIIRKFARHSESSIIVPLN